MAAYFLQTLNISLQFDSADLGCMPHDRTLVAGTYSFLSLSVFSDEGGFELYIYVLLCV